MSDKTLQLIEAHLATLVRCQIRTLELAENRRVHEPTEHGADAIAAEHAERLAELERWVGK